MDKPNMLIIRPLTEKPNKVIKQILYPQYVAEVMVNIPRVIFRPRKLKVFLVVDGCTGKIFRSDGWPSTKTTIESKYETVSLKVNEEEAKTFMIDYANKKIARRYQSYWKPQIDIMRLSIAYKTFWMTEQRQAVDSLTARKLDFA